MEASARSGWRGAATQVFGALEGAAAAIPTSLGCALIVFGRVAPDLVANGVFATMLGLVAIHLLTAGSTRPVCFAARIFEATTLAAMIEQLAPQLAGWGLEDTAGVRLAFLCALSGGAGAVVALLYLVRAERLTPFIPGPVFAGFSNSIAITLAVSQVHSLRHLIGEPSPETVTLSIAAIALLVAYAIRRWLPGRPAAAVALGVGLLAGVAWSTAGESTIAIGGGRAGAALPFFLADFAALARPGVQLGPVAMLVVGNAAILGTMVFINTALAAQSMTQFDRRHASRRADGVIAGLGMFASGVAGAAPVSGSILACLAVSRTAALRWQTLCLLALVVAGVYLTGVLEAMPLAAIVGVLLCESWFLVDRPSLRLAAEWLRRQPLPRNAQEDLALIASVTALAVITNMVVAAFGGLVLGLFLFALRSGRKPVRHVWNGTQVSSNCARCSADLRILAQHGEKLLVFELEGDMFFAVGASLDRSLTAHSEGARCLVLDWSRVRHLDSSVAGTVASFERQAADDDVFVVHAGANAAGHDSVAAELRRRMPAVRLAPDLDYALELAENQLVAQHAGAAAGDASSVFDTMQLFDGFTPGERAALEFAMAHRLFRAGEVILQAGERSDELMLVLQGSASILLRNADGQPVRLAGVRRGAVLGEIGFLDGSARSATVVAQEDVLVAILARDAYEELSRASSSVVAKLLANLSVALARRLRHANELALARARHL